ncbi:gp16 family protein [Undibacterium sp. Xuan67W]|uniref:gp16 family protein n=1 Tax=Undibacterium sp. Xuan67W TaxID=3413057 RepID=UPI003BF23B4A
MTPLKTADQLRQAEMAQIHIAKKELALEDDAYRALLLQVTGKTSSKDLTWQGRKALLDHFKKIGWKPKGKAGGRGLPQVAPDRMPRMRKIEALLAEAKRPWSYLDPIVKNLKRSSIQFCDVDDLSKIIAALTADAKRHGRV